jgi:hypothetical protein
LEPLEALHDRTAAPVAIVFSRWTPDVNTTVTRLGCLETLLRLEDSGLWVEHERASIQKFLDLIQSLPRFELIYSDVEEATAFVKSLL